MEEEKFKLSKRIITYKCGCKVEIFNFESNLPSDKCEKHGADAITQTIIEDEI